LEKWVALVKGLPALPKLEKLVVANTGMVDPPAAASLTHLKTLSLLDASGNRLWSIKTELNVSTLTSLNLRDNQLRELPLSSYFRDYSTLLPAIDLIFHNFS
jgi:Leucine-rich repeat (LRR) protein